MGRGGRLEAVRSGDAPATVEDEGVACAVAPSEVKGKTGVTKATTQDPNPAPQPHEGRERVSELPTCRCRRSLVRKQVFFRDKNVAIRRKRLQVKNGPSTEQNWIGTGCSCGGLLHSRSLLHVHKLFS